MSDKTKLIAQTLGLAAAIGRSVFGNGFQDAKAKETERHGRGLFSMRKDLNDYVPSKRRNDDL